MPDADLSVQQRKPGRKLRLSSLSERENVFAVGAKRQRNHVDCVLHVERGVKMREQRAAARRLPLQNAAECVALDRDENKVRLAGEMLRRGFLDLLGGGEMDVAVLQVDRCAAEDAFRFG